jgi:hypothetical protein
MTRSNQRERTPRKSKPDGDGQLPQIPRWTDITQEEMKEGAQAPKFSEITENNPTFLERYVKGMGECKRVEIKVEGGCIPSKYCMSNHGGYCHDPMKLGQAEHAVKDRRQDRERKIKERKRIGPISINVTGRYVFACCKAVRRYLEDFKTLYAVRGNITRDHVTT